MKLYLLRHAPAVERRIGRRDFDRALTAPGARRMRRIARAMRRAGIEPDAIYCSPLLRTRQTATIVAETLRAAPQPTPATQLAPGGQVQVLLREIAARHTRPTAVVMLVGHEPDLGWLLSMLLTGERRSAFRFRKGGFCRLEVPPRRLRYGRCAALEWFIAPRVFGSRNG